MEIAKKVFTLNVTNKSAEFKIKKINCIQTALLFVQKIITFVVSGGDLSVYNDVYSFLYVFIESKKDVFFLCRVA